VPDPGEEAALSGLGLRRRNGSDAGEKR
jgi:hypothetical protein